MRRKMKNQKGFTLLEVMISMLVFSIGLMALAPMGVIAIKANKWSDRTTQAAFFLQEKIEDLKNQDPPVNGTDNVSGMTRTWTIQQLSSNLWQLDIRIDWTDQDNRARRYRTITYASQ